VAVERVRGLLEACDFERVSARRRRRWFQKCVHFIKLKGPTPRSSRFSLTVSSILLSTLGRGLREPWAREIFNRLKATDGCQLPGSDKYIINIFRLSSLSSIIIIIFFFLNSPSFVYPIFPLRMTRFQINVAHRSSRL